METTNQLIQDYNYTLSDINYMMPYEFEITVLMIQKNLELKKSLRNQM